MFRPSQSQTGAFFGILASVLILVLTAMALASMDGRPARRSAHIEAADVTPAGLSIHTSESAASGR